MRTLAAVFDQQDHLDQAIKSLFEADLPSKNVVTLASDDAQQEPSASMNPGAGRLAAGISQDPADRPTQGGNLSDFDVGDEEYEFYRQIADEGKSAVVFVRVDDDRYEQTLSILEESEAQQVDTLS